MTIYSAIYWVPLALSVIVPLVLAYALFLWWKATRHWTLIVFGLTACMVPIVQMYLHVYIGVLGGDERGTSPEEYDELFVRIDALHCLLWIALGVGGVGLAFAARRQVQTDRDLAPDEGE